MSLLTEHRPDVARLLEIVDQLDSSELHAIENHVRAVKAKRRAALALSQEEKRRIAAILKTVPDASRNRYAALVSKRQETDLQEEEQEELVRLSDWIEAVEVKRLEYLAELASQRRVSLMTLMDTLGIKSPSYA